MGAGSERRLPALRTAQGKPVRTRSDDLHAPDSPVTMNGPDTEDNCKIRRPESRFRRLAAWYEDRPFAQLLKAMQPLGILVTAVGLLIAIAALFATIYEIRQSRTVREATLLVLAMERIAIARESDLGKEATTKSGNGKWRCSTGRKQHSARAGQIPLLERMVRLDISLRDILLRDTNLVVARTRRERTEEELRGIDLGDANLSYADLRNTNLRNALLSGATLTSARMDRSCLKEAFLIGAHLQRVDLGRSDLDRADLSKTDLTEADLYQVDFQRATLTGAIFINADLTGADFSRAKGLTQAQLDSACAKSDEPPVDLPRSQGRRLTWKPRECP